MHKVYKLHIHNLEEIGQLGNNLNYPENPSYSMMHSLENTGFSIVLFTGTHRGFPNSTVHRNRSVRLILGADMICIWNEGTMHSGAKSRVDKNGDVMADNRFFHMYGLRSTQALIRVDRRPVLTVVKISIEKRLCFVQNGVPVSVHNVKKERYT